MIEAKQLTCISEGCTAVRDISFKIQNGRVYGILGPSGAGKSTLLGLLAGALVPDAGQVKLNGFDMASEQARARACIGYAPAKPPLYDTVTPFEYLSFVADAKGLSSLRAMRQIHEALELTDTDSVRDRLIGNLSEAARVRLGIAQALIGKPEILLLDAPTAGLDPRSASELRELIRMLSEAHTVLLATADLSEAESLCDHVLLLSNGTLLANAPLEDLAGNAEAEGSLRALFLRASAEAAAAEVQPAPTRTRDGAYELIDEEDNT